MPERLFRLLGNRTRLRGFEPSFKRIDYRVWSEFQVGGAVESRGGDSTGRDL